MAIHVPLSSKAQEEAKQLMLAKENIFGPANAQPITVPNREMALGCYYITSILPSKEEEKVLEFNEAADAIRSYHLGFLKIKQKIRVRIGKEMLETSVGRILFNEVLPSHMGFLNVAVKGITIRDIILLATQTMTKDE